MILFEPFGIYGVEAGSPYLQRRNLTLDARYPIHSLDELHGSLYAHNIHPGDFAVHAAVADRDEMGYETFLVTQIAKNVGELVPVPTFLENFDMFANVALTRRLQTAPFHVEELGLRGLTNELAKRFPLHQKPTGGE